MSGRAWRLSAVLVIAALLAWAFYPRTSQPPVPAPPAVRAPQIPVPASLPAPPARAGGTTGQPAAPSTAEDEDSMPAAATTDSLAAGSATAEERQLIKIARGLSLGSDGALHVSATPPGSVVGQLHLQPGDVIVSVNGHPVASPEDFARIYHEQGLPAELTLLRGGREVHRH